MRGWKLIFSEWDKKLDYHATISSKPFFHSLKILIFVRDKCQKWIFFERLKKLLFMSSTTMTALVNLRMHTDVSNAFPKFTCIMYGDLFFSRSAFCKPNTHSWCQICQEMHDQRRKETAQILNESPQVLYASECLCNFGMSDSSTP